MVPAGITIVVAITRHTGPTLAIVIATQVWFETSAGIHVAGGTIPSAEQTVPTSPLGEPTTQRSSGTTDPSIGFSIAGTPKTLSHPHARTSPAAPPTAPPLRPRPARGPQR